MSPVAFYAPSDGRGINRAAWRGQFDGLLRSLCPRSLARSLAAIMSASVLHLLHCLTIITPLTI